MRVCYFGSYNPAYPRNKIIREGLALSGVEVVECNVPLDASQGLAQRYRRLVSLWQPLARLRFDAIILPEFNHKNLPLAYILARKSRTALVFDPLVSRYNTAVEDRQQAKPGTPRALQSFLVDWFAFHLPDVVLADTQQHRQYYSARWRADPQKIRVVYIGADETFFYAAEQPLAATLPTVLFFGNYIPLHGADVIVKAYASLSVTERAHFRLVMIGDGQTFPAIQEMTQQLGLSGIEFMPSVTMETLAHSVRQASICLGIFGTTHKAQRVIPNKVFESLAAEKPVITGDSPAIRELFTSGQHLMTVPCGDERALASAIRSLLRDPATATALGRAGGALVRARYSRKEIGQQVLQAIPPAACP